jgi:hypothetical protein
MDYLLSLVVVFCLLFCMATYICAWSLGCIRFCHPLSLLNLFLLSDGFPVLVYSFIFMLWTPLVYERDVLMPHPFSMYSSILFGLGWRTCYILLSCIYLSH